MYNITQTEREIIMETYEKIKDKYVNDYMKKGTLASKDEIKNILDDVLKTLSTNKDMTLHEYIGIFLSDIN